MQGRIIMTEKHKHFWLYGSYAIAIFLLIAPTISKAQESPFDYSGSESIETSIWDDDFYEEEKPLDYTGKLWERSTLTGDWGGKRNELAQKGITFKSTVTQIYQSNFTDGSNDRRYGRYSGSADYEMNLDFGKMGLWPGGFLKVRGMTGLRKSLNSKAGSIMSVNSNALFPSPDGKDTALTDFLFMQFLSENFGLLVGKMNTLDDGDVNEFAHSYNTQFLNTALLINPVTFLTSPYSTFGIGALLFNEVATYTFSVIDTEESATNSGSGTVFHNGTTVASQLRFKTCIAGRPGHQLFGGTWSNKKYDALKQDPRTLLGAILLPNRGMPLKTQNGSWCFYYNMDHYLYLKEGTLDQGVGVFARYGVSDGKANLFKYFASLGIGGKGIIPGRDQDTFGIGYYHVWFSDRLPNFVYRRLIDKHENGGELYYNVALSPWLHLTPSLQVIQSGLKSVNNSVVVGGLRLVIDL